MHHLKFPDTIGREEQLGHIISEPTELLIDMMKWPLGDIVVPGIVGQQEIKIHNNHHRG